MVKIVQELEVRGRESYILFKFARYGMDYDIHASKKLKILEKFPVFYNGQHKQIDVVWTRGESTYIIEAKPELDFEAIGQVFVYEHFYKKSYPEESIKKGIVCEDITDQMFLHFCLQKDITVFELTKDGVIKEHEPSTI